MEWCPWREGVADAVRAIENLETGKVCCLRGGGGGGRCAHARPVGNWPWDAVRGRSLVVA